MQSNCSAYQRSLRRNSLPLTGTPGPGHLRASRFFGASVPALIFQTIFYWFCIAFGSHFCSSLSNFDVILRTFFDLGFWLAFLVIFHGFWVLQYLKNHVFTAVLQQKSRFCKLQNNSEFHQFLHRFVHAFGPILAHIFITFSTPIFAQLFDDVFSEFWCQNGSQNDLKMLQLSSQGTSRDVKIRLFLQKVVLGTVGSIWFSLDAVLAPFLWILGLF